MPNSLKLFFGCLITALVTNYLVMQGMISDSKGDLQDLMLGVGVIGGFFVWLAENEARAEDRKAHKKDGDDA